MIDCDLEFCLNPNVGVKTLVEFNHTCFIKMVKPITL